MAKNYILKTFTRSILFCFFMLATMGLSAQTTNPTTPTAPAQPTEKYKPQKGGSVQNPNPVRIEYPQAFLTKKGTKTNVPGEYWIDLKIEGRQTEGSEPADVVLLVDRSWSMGKVQNGDVDPTDNVKKPRWHFAREAIKKVLNEIIPDTNSNFNVGMVMFDSFSKFNDPDYRMPLSKDKDALFNSLVNEIQYNRAKAGTNIQAGILNAYDLIKTGNGRQKYIIVIGDGAPSFLSPPKTLVETPTKLPGGYGGVSTGSIIMNKEKPFYAIDKIDDNISLWGGQILPKTLDVTEAPQGTPSKIRILSNEYPIESALYVSKKAQPDVKILAVGVCLKLIDQGRDVLKGLVEDTKKDYYETPSASDLPKLLKAIAKRIVGTVKSGKVTDPMSEKVDLVLPADGSFEKGRDYFLTASAPEVLNPVTVQRKDGSLMEVIEPVTVGQENGTLSIKGLTLTVNEWVNVRYKVRLKDEFRTGELALANDTTTLDYDGYKDDDTPLNFNIPQVELFEGKARLTKTFGGQAPPNGVQATFKLYEKVGEIDTAENGETDDKLIGEYTTNDKGKIEVQKLFVGDYYFKEISTADKYKLVKDAIKFSITGGSRDWQELATVDNPLKIVPNPSIKLEKTTDKATDYKLIKGETITYNFKVTNTGNVTLTDVKVADPLTDLSAISPECCNLST
ncbi:MAG: VWA domain-containing protein [Flavobacteriaceae bacterium]|nr:VWA domain-containing protein [Flavobacteriaceae bacterium]